MDVQKRVLRTDSLVTDALLGQGEALDCYNMKLQDSAALAAQYRNERYSQETVDAKRKLDAALAVIDAITDPLAKADAYKKMLNTCCPEDLMLLMGSLCNGSGTTA